MKTDRKPDATLIRPLQFKYLVYVAWDENGTCLYVGQSSIGLGRPFTNPTLDTHKDEVAQLDIYTCADRNESIHLERILTGKYGPVYDRTPGSLLALRREKRTFRGRGIWRRE